MTSPNRTDEQRVEHARRVLAEALGTADPDAARRLREESRIQHRAGQEVSAASALGDDLDELEALAAQLLTVRNRVRVKARSLHTAREVGDYQTSEAELVAAPLRQRITELEALLTETMPSGCSGVHRLEQQLATAQSQIRALRASVLEAREQERRVRAAWTTEVERGRDLEADLSRLREELARRYTLANVMDQRAEAREELMREYEAASVGLLRAALESLDASRNASLILDISNHLGKIRTGPPAPPKAEE